jgi:predicted RNase H-like nuclease (RuvC/YqgF family)
MATTTTFGTTDNMSTTNNTTTTTTAGTQTPSNPDEEFTKVYASYWKLRELTDHATSKWRELEVNNAHKCEEIKDLERKLMDSQAAVQAQKRSISQLEQQNREIADLERKLKDSQSTAQAQKRAISNLQQQSKFQDFSLMVGRKKNVTLENQLEEANMKVEILEDEVEKLEEEVKTGGKRTRDAYALEKPKPEPEPKRAKVSKAKKSRRRR